VGAARFQVSETERVVTAGPTPLKPCLRPKRALQYPIRDCPETCQQIDISKSPIGLVEAKRLRGDSQHDCGAGASPFCVVKSFYSSLAPLPKLALGAAVALAALSLSPGSAQAACAPGTPSLTCRVTVGGLEYDVTYFTGNYNNNQNKFGLPPAPGVMPWWGSSSTALDFATAVGDGLGAPTNDNPPNGPYFAYQLSSVGALPTVRFAFRSNGANPIAITTADADYNNLGPWAQAVLVPPTRSASVPGPLPLLGAGAAFGWSRQLRKRIQVSRLPAGSGQPRA
jgi:hypothetical protein